MSDKLASDMSTGETADMGSENENAERRRHSRSDQDGRVPVTNLICPVTPAGPLQPLRGETLVYLRKGLIENYWKPWPV